MTLGMKACQYPDQNAALQRLDYKFGGLLTNMSGYTGADSHGHTQLHNEIYLGIYEFRMLLP